MADRTIQLQHQIRHNASSIREYFDDLDKWQDDINSLDSQLAGKKSETPSKEAKPLPPVRSEVPPRLPSEHEKAKFQRDRAPMRDYYKAWDKFDVVRDR